MVSSPKNLAITQKLIIFEDSTMLPNICLRIQKMESVFHCSNKVVKTCSEWLKLSRNKETEYNFEAYFHILDTFHASYLSAFKYSVALNLPCRTEAYSELCQLSKI